MNQLKQGQRYTLKRRVSLENNTELSRDALPSARMIGWDKSPYKYFRSKNDRPYQLVYWEEHKTSQIQEYKTRKELDKDVSKLLKGKPLTIKFDAIGISNFKPVKVYPIRFYINRQIGGNYCLKKLISKPVLGESGK